MAATIYTDSSDYSEDFEDFESISEEHRKFSEQDVFPRLFDYLEASFSNDSYVNYENEQIPLELAVGRFLTKAQSSKQDILDKVEWEYSLKKQNLFKRAYIKDTFHAFPKTIKSLTCLSRCESEFLNFRDKKDLKKIVDEVRTSIMANLGVLGKDKTQAQIMLLHENMSIGKKSEDLQEQFYWTRFSELLKSLIPGKIIFSVPSEKKRISVKTAIEIYFKQHFSIKNIISLEDSDFQSALGNRRALQQGPERKLEISEQYSHYHKTSEILSKFLTFTSKALPAPPLNPYPLSTFLCKSCN